MRIIMICTVMYICIIGWISWVKCDKLHVSIFPFFLGIVASSESGRSLVGDDSSLGILQLDGLPGKKIAV